MHIMTWKGFVEAPPGEELHGFVLQARGTQVLALTAERLRGRYLRQDAYGDHEQVRQHCRVDLRHMRKAYNLAR